MATAVAAGTESAEGPPGPAAALELWLNKATDPSMSEQDWSAIQNFCDQVNTDPNGPTHAPWLLAHKIQSPQEKEALYALTVLEMCVNHCGGKFHSEVAKFRFLNELIKVLSPKYLGSWTTDRVKGRVMEILFSWTVWFPEDMKIRDAYQMLKQQGIIKQDPKLPVDKILPPPSPWPKSSIFDADEEKSKVRVRGPLCTLPQPRFQVVYERCERLRPTLFRLASDTDGDDDALAEILQASDFLTQGVRLYKQVMEGRVSAGNTAPSAVGGAPVCKVFQNPAGCTRNCLIDLEADGGSKQAGTGTPSLLHQDLAALGLSDGPATNKAASQSCCEEKPNPASPTTGTPPAGGGQSPSAEQSLLDLLSPQPPSGSLNYIPQKSIPEEVPPGTKSSPGWSWEAGSLTSSSSSQNAPLAQVFVPLESVKPSSLPPIVVYDRKGFRILLHFSETGAPGHPEVHVLLLTLMSTATQPVWNISFQVAVPKSMRVKLQPASSSKLPAFNPLVPPAVISQVLLLDNPHKEPIRLRYKLTFNQGGQPFSEVGEVKDFPDLAVLGAA
ncbi:PREDICTED: ADP-ribosylation factor-binding protein GGA2 [Hipposideros armiger]|uniref:ADP-ribosylation factor-binding protein GGA2 n=1 Tax=Hipposideros armiger TaxID=186990 RepID=A0A8B7RWE7_HIPAR|nr:PREDICTED: ADP-ribosylation factor-binding protein GGA2 [Hipposideros armiger]